MITNLVSETFNPPIHKQNLAYQSLLGLRVAGIKYCLWKSFDRLEEGIRGETDFDILFGKEQKPAIFNYLNRNGWMEVLAEPWRQFPDVYDFIQYDPHYKKYIHFHVHFRLVMGEKNIKSLYLPLESLYLQNATETGGIYHSNPEIELCVFILRLSLKVGWRDYARVVRRRDRKMIFGNMTPEFQFIHQRCDRTRFEIILEHPSFSFLDQGILRDVYKDIYALNFDCRRRIKKQIAPYRRYGKVERVFVGLQRNALKNSFGIGKTFPRRGKTFAFCGPDGSGKTTLIHAIEKRLAKHFKVARYYMGGNQHSKGVERGVYNFLFWAPYQFIRKIFKIISFQSIVKRMEQIYRGNENYLIAKEKLGRYNSAMRESAQGAIVLFERFPLFQDPDHSGDSGLPNGGYSCEKKERALYDQIGEPDVIFVLRVDSEIAIRRKPDHSAKVIRNKTSAFEEYIHINQNNPKVMTLDGNAPMDLVVETALDSINRELARDS